MTLAVLVMGFFLAKDEFNFLETSFLHILKNIAEDNKPDVPDLTIEKVTLRKIGDPSEDFNYYKYYANVVIKNEGGLLKNATVTLGSENQKNVFLTNDEEGLTIKPGGSYIYDRLELYFDGDYNGGVIDLKVDLRDRRDRDEDNNVYSVEVFEGPAKIQSIGVKDILMDGQIVLDFYPKNFGLNLDDFQTVSSEKKDFSDEEKYAELHTEEGVFGYHRVKSDLAKITGEDWVEEDETEIGAHYLDYFSNAYKPDRVVYAYVKAINPDNGNYAVSNILKFSPQEDLTRGAFAKYFVEESDLEPASSPESVYDDVAADAWFGPHVNTLYDEGLINSLDSEFKPESVMNRAEALQVVVDYCDLDLEFPEVGSFEDVSLENEFYPFIEAFKANKLGRIFEEKFSPYEAATKTYLKYIINECKKDS